MISFLADTVLLNMCYDVLSIAMQFSTLLILDASILSYCAIATSYGLVYRRLLW
jgi:hypothetical protein